MFVTNETPEAPIAGPVHDEGYKAWHHVTLPAQIHLYLVEYRLHISAGFGIGRSAFLNSIEQLTELQNDPNVAIEEVYLLSTGSLNNSDSWLLEPLQQISEGKIDNEEELATIYELKNGNHYIDFLIDIDLKQITSTRPLFTSE